MRIISFSLVVLLLISCSKDEERLSDMEIIENYLSENNLVAQSTASGLHYIIENPGVGEKPTITNTVTVHYQGYFLNGNIFDSSFTAGMPAEFPLTRVIRGWQEGIPLFARGGKGTLIIPSNLAYGSNPPAGIPANEVLAFDVELLDFK